MSGEQTVIAFNVLWKMMVGIGVLALGLASVLYAGQLKLDDNKLDKEIFTQYRAEANADRKEYRKENSEAHATLSGFVGAIKADIREIKTILEERSR